ncbi:plasmid replication protein RepB, partial [Aeromonas caviae]
MQEKEAKTMFDMGGFSKAMIVPTPMGSGFHL